MPLEEILDRQMDPVVFPVPLKALAADLTITEVSHGTFEIDGFLVEAFRLRHPGTTLGYKLVPGEGRADRCLCDRQRVGQWWQLRCAAGLRRQLAKFLSGVDTLIHDGMYSEAMIESRRAGGTRRRSRLSGSPGMRVVGDWCCFTTSPNTTTGDIDALLAGARSYAGDPRAGTHSGRPQWKACP